MPIQLMSARSVVNLIGACVYYLNDAANSIDTIVYDN